VRLRTIVYSHGLSAISRSSARRAARRADEGVLDDLLGVVVRAAQQLARVADEPLLVAGVDRVEGAVVARAHQVDELLVAGGR
jgi:hypothetical protein